MRIGITLLICIFILCCTGAARPLLRRLSLRADRIAAWSLIVAALSAFTFPLGTHVSFHPAAMLVAALGILHARCTDETPIAILLALFSGILGWFGVRLFPSFFDTALLAALPAAVLSRLVPLQPRQGLMCTLTTPIFYGFAASAENWYLFDEFVFSLGSVEHLDIQLCGAFLYTMLAAVPVWRAKKYRRMQKEY